nr:MAG TPA: hypothetical protein [Caudoviricetes sp.]
MAIFIGFMPITTVLMVHQSKNLLRIHLNYWKSNTYKTVPGARTFSITSSNVF